MSLKLESAKYILNNLQHPHTIGQTDIAASRMIKSLLVQGNLEDSPLNRGRVLAQLVSDFFEEIKPVGTVSEEVGTWTSYCIGYIRYVDPVANNPAQILEILGSFNRLRLIVGRTLDEVDILMKAAGGITTGQITEHLEDIATRFVAWTKQRMSEYEIEYVNEFDKQRELHSSFVGRELEMSDLSRRMEKQRIVAIVGVGGIGKTALGVNFASHYSVQTGQPVFWYQMREGHRSTVSTILWEVAHFLAFWSYDYTLLNILELTEPEYTAQMKTDLAIQKLIHNSCLICFDDFHFSEPDVQAFLDQMGEEFCRLSHEDGSRLLLISRTSPQAIKSDDFVVTLSGLSPDEIGGFLRAKQLSASSSQLETLERITSGNPKLIEMVIPQLDQLDDMQLTSTQFLEGLRETLGPDERKVVNALSVFRYPVSLNTLSYATEMPIPQVKYSLDSLQSQSLVSVLKEEQEEQQYYIHDLPREYFDQNMHRDVRLNLLQKAAEYFQRRGDTLEAIHFFAQIPDHGRVHELLVKQFDSLLQSEAENLSRILAELPTKELPELDYYLGRLSLAMNKPLRAKSHLENYIGTPNYDPRALLFLARVERSQVQFAEALERVNRLKSLLMSDSNFAGTDFMFDTLLEELTIYDESGQFDEGISFAQEILALTDALNGKDRALAHKVSAATCVILVRINRKKGDWIASVTAGQKALRMITPDDLLLQGEILLHLSISFWNQSKWRLASNNADRALKIFRQKGDLVNSARCLNILGLIAWNQGVWDKAESSYLEGLALAESINARFHVGIFYENLGALYYDQGDQQKAEEYLDQAILALEGAADYQAYAEFYKGLLQRDSGYTEQGLSMCLSALGVFELREYSPYYIGMLHREIGLTYAMMEQADSALTHLQKAQHEHESDMGSFYQLAKTYWAMGKYHHQQHDFDQAQRYLCQAIDIFEQLDCSRYVLLVRQHMTNPVDDKIGTKEAQA